MMVEGGNIIFYNTIIYIFIKKKLQKNEEKNLSVSKKVVLLHPQSKAIEFFFRLVR